MYEGLLIVLSVVAGAVAALSGFGIGSLLTPALAIEYGTKVGVALVAMPHLAGTVVRLWALRPHVDRHVLLTFGLASAAGGLVGAVLHAFLGSPALTILLGALLVLSGASELTRLGRRVRFRGALATVGGALSGLFGGLVGNQGGIRSGALLRFDLSPQALVATATASALLVDLVRVPIYLVSNLDDVLDAWPLVLGLAVGVVVGTLGGAPMLRRIPERVFRPALAVLLVVLGVVLVLTAAW